MAMKAFMRELSVLQGSVYFFFQCNKDKLIITDIYLIKTVKPESTRLSNDMKL